MLKIRMQGTKKDLHWFWRLLERQEDVDVKSVSEPFTINALVAADSVLIPVEAAYLPVKGLQQLIKTIGRVHRKLNPALNIMGILLTKVDRRTNFARDISAQIREVYGNRVHIFENCIPLSVKAAETTAEGKSIYEDGEHPYSHSSFYEASTDKTADVFRCVETGKNYLPGEHELFEYVGEFVPFIQQEKQAEELELPQAGAAVPDLEGLQEEPDAEEYDLIENRLFLAMEEADVYLDDFSPEQVDVIYEAAEKGLNLVPMLNPEFPPEQMQLIADVMERMAANEQAAFGNEVNPLTDHVMNPEEINHIRKDRRLPLEPVAVDGIDGARGNGNGSTRQASGQAGRDAGTGGPSPGLEHREKINFHITDDDLGAGGLKQKFRANMDAILLLKTLEQENRLATPEEQETLSRFVGWGGIPAAFDDKNEAWAAEYAELKSALTLDEYREARASTLNAFYTSPTVIIAMYEALEDMGLQKGNVLDITTIRLIQKYDRKYNRRAA